MNQKIDSHSARQALAAADLASSQIKRRRVYSLKQGAADALMQGLSLALFGLALATPVHSLWRVAAVVGVVGGAVVYTLIRKGWSNQAGVHAVSRFGAPLMALFIPVSALAYFTVAHLHWLWAAPALGLAWAALIFVSHRIDAQTRP